LKGKLERIMYECDTTYYSIVTAPSCTCSIPAAGNVVAGTFIIKGPLLAKEHGQGVYCTVEYREDTKE
jgi:hypothetical protein